DAMNTHRFRTMLRREMFIPATALILLSLVAVSGLSYGRAQSDGKGEREVEEKIPKHLPIKVKVRKPEKLKDASNEDWLGELEVEVTNTGAKPIYYLYISVFLPDVVAPTGHNFGFPLQYGRTRLVAFDEPVGPDDVPLLPGEVVVLKVPAEQAELWRRGREKGDRANPRKIEFIFSNINFGDGTGFVTSDGVPIPNTRERGANDTCPGGDGNAAGAASAADPPRRYFPDIASLATYLPPPVNLVPAFFFDRPASPPPAMRQDLCCASGCSRLKEAADQGCECPIGERRIVQSTSCSDPAGVCGSIIYESFQCMVNGQERFCERSRIGPTCADPTPTPTPTPVPCPQPGPNYCCREVTSEPAMAGQPAYCEWTCADCPPGTPLAAGCIARNADLTCPEGYEASLAFGLSCCPKSGGAQQPCYVTGDCPETNDNGGGGGPPWSPVLLDTAGDGFALTGAAGGVSS
ncbi:MAG TPA: hypothetical protein VF570_06415, partial [Pyrinomonadaceae bacterium]